MGTPQVSCCGCCAPTACSRPQRALSHTPAAASPSPRPQDWYFEIPPITRTYVTGSVLTTAACSLELISPFSLYLDATLVIYKSQFWRLLTNFLFFGAIGVDFMFHMFFLARYCRLLEDGSFRNRRADFVLMLLFGGGLMCLIAPFVNIPPFLGNSLAFMMVYVWAR